MAKTYILVLYFVISYSLLFEAQRFEGPYYFSIRRAFDVEMKSVDYMTIMTLETIYIQGDQKVFEHLMITIQNTTWLNLTS
jgi:hypothetical protein